jgi:hypothetical protein
VCTWVECAEPATVPQRGRDGSQWADLCADHDKQLSDAIASGNPKKLMSAYIKAQGGAKKAAERMAPGAQKVVSGLMAALRKP